MANSKIIIVEGPQGAGKTTITDYIRNMLPYTNLYRLSGTSDSSEQGKVKAIKMYDDLMKYIKSLENMSINLLFDRTFFTEEIYCRLGFKEYSFTDKYEELLERLSKMDFEIYYITLYLGDTNEYEKRLIREGKADVKYAKFNIESSINQQNEYMKMSNEIEGRYKAIHVIRYDTSRDISITKNEIKELLK